MQDITLTNLGGGVLQPRFQEALQEALQNIADESTPAKAPRVIKIELRITPSPERDSGQIEVAVTTKFPTRKVATVPLFFGVEDDGFRARQLDETQLTLGMTQEGE